MKLIKKHKKITTVFNLTSMIDIIMLLLCFFMVVSQLTFADKIKIQLPESKSAKTDPAGQNTVDINITSEGKIVVHGIEYDEFTISDKLKEIAEKDTNQKIIFRASENIDWQIVKETMKQTKESGLLNTEMAVISE